MKRLLAWCAVMAVGLLLTYYVFSGEGAQPALSILAGASTMIGLLGVTSSVIDLGWL